MRKLILWSLFILASINANAQLPPPCSPGQAPADECGDACIYCNFNGIVSSTNGYTEGPANGFCGSIENDQWLGFIANATSATFTATPLNCTNGDGVQIALYDDCNGVPVDCNGGQDNGGNIPVNLTNVPLVPGTNYYLLIDGFGGDQCTFSITVDPPIAVIAPPIGNNIGPIMGPSQVCPGATVTYSVPPVPNAGAYTWTVPNGWLINGQSSPQQILTIDGGNEVQITFGPNGGTICVQATNSCYPNGPSTCKTITVAPIPATVLPAVAICNEDAPYDLPWGEQAPSSGTYQTTLESYLGCDSVVRQQVTIKSPLVSFLQPKTICAGDHVTVCDVDYFDGGSFSHMCESFQGCDSVINFSITVLDPVAQINGGGVITCTNSSVQLSAAPSQTGTLFTWKNLAGQNLGINNSITVTTAGTYILTATLNGGGIQCVKADTVVVPSNTTLPSILASGGTLNCTVNSVELLALSNAATPLWNWAGPGGFNASIANPVATLLGTYTVTVTNNLNGCTASASTTVNGDTAPPAVETFGATLTCSITSAQITANAMPAAALFEWAGPMNFTSSIQTPTITNAGTYTVTVTNTLNNCTTTGTALVSLNNTPPGASASTTGEISCTTPSIQINGDPGDPGNTFSWTGPNNFMANTQVATADLSGIYTVTVRGTNGCTSTATTMVNGNTLAPDASAVGDTVSCGTTSVTLLGSSLTSGASFGWTGPAGFVSTLQNPIASDTGVYILTVTGTNECTATATALVSGNFGAPDVSATGGTITCTQSTTNISGNSNTPGATLEWNGPGGFMSDLPLVVVNTVGDYILTVTAPNGCTSSATASVVPDANLPNATADGGALTCVVDTVFLNGGTTSQGVSILWSGPNNFSSIAEDPAVTVDGVYILTVTDNINGCTAQASATVALDDAEPGATAQGDTLTCANPALDLAGASTAGNVSWLWTGPNNFMSVEQNPNTTEAGSYLLTVTNLDNGCTSTAGTNVELDMIAPVASSNTGILTCTLDSLTLNAMADMASSFSWIAPNGEILAGPSAIVTLPGDYTLMATALTNGCTGNFLLTVGQDILPPGGTAVGDTISCLTPQVIITADSPLAVDYTWSGPGTFNGATQNPVVSTGGLYTVTITGANGCTSTAEATVALDTEPPVIVAVANDFVTCFAPSVNIQTNITALSPVVSTVWSGPNNYTSSNEDALVFEGGLYTIVATSQNGCTTESQVNVQEDTAVPDVFATGGTLTCIDTMIQIDGESQTPGVLYSWSGPNNFSSSDEDPEVINDGTYTVVVTSQNGCRDSVMVMVNLDITLPGATANASNNLDCDDLNTTLTASSPTSGVGYSWSGPNNFSATSATAVASLPGTYEVAVTGTNGCVSTSTIVVTEDIADPDADGMGGTLDCISGQLNLTGISATQGATFFWTGPNNFSSPLQNPPVTVAGQYILTVTGPNGCTTLASANVAENTDSPEVTIGGAGTLTCVVTDLTLTSTIETAGATGVWTGPNNFTAGTLDITVSIPGNYVFTVTALNGCISSPALVILEDVETPQSVTATGGLLNCTFPTITLNASSISEVSYNWSGPGNFASPEQDPAVTNPGDYVVTVTGLSNGCTATAVATVTQDPTVPDIDVQADSLTCSTTSVTLNATSNTPDVTYLWSGPNNFTAAIEDPQATVPGLYSVVVEAQSGCTATYNFNLTQNIDQPDISASGDTLTCLQPSGQLNSVSATQGTTFAWSGPNGFNATLPAPSVTQSGLYTVVVTAPNGCTAAAQAIVTADQTPPVITVTGGTITCLTSDITLGATANVPVMWQWSGPGGFSATIQNPNVSLSGNYTLTATAVNGCVSNQSAVVMANTQQPNVAVDTPDELDCTTTQVSLTAQVIGTGQYGYQWDTQNGVILSGANTNTPQVTQAGVYFVVVTNLANGCTASNSATVIVDPATPSGAGLAKKNISCYGETDGAIQIDSVTGGTPPFVYSVDNQGFTSNNYYPALTPGTHSLVVQDANGCEYATSFFIDEPEELVINLGPDTTIHLGATIEITLDHYVNDPDRVVQTLVTPSTLVLPDTLTPTYSFRYQVEVVDSSGCRARDERFIVVDRERWVYIPNIIDPNSAQNSLLMVFGGEDVELVKTFLVFDRWGNAIHAYKNFVPNDPATGWDGTYKGEALNPGVFVYYAEVLFKDGETVKYKGDVTLVR